MEYEEIGCQKHRSHSYSRVMIIFLLFLSARRQHRRGCRNQQPSDMMNEPLPFYERCEDPLRLGRLSPPPPPPPESFNAQGIWKPSRREVQNIVSLRVNVRVVFIKSNYVFSNILIYHVDCIFLL